MKNLVLLFCAMMIAGVSYGQVKVISTGATKIGDTGTTPKGKLHVTGSSTLELALDATAGNPDFTLQSGGATKAQVKYSLPNQGLGFFANNANTGTVGLGDPSDLGMLIKGTNLRVGIGTTSPATALEVDGVITYMGGSIGSDKRLKKDIKDYDGGLEEILRIQPKYFRYNNIIGRKDRPERQEVGIIAQEFEKIAPEFIGSFTHEEWSGSADGETSTLTSSEDYLSVNTDAIKYMLVNAVKEQQEIIDNQEERINDLEGQLNEVLDLLKNSEVLNLNGGKAALGQNRPNPFTTETTIDYFVPEKSSKATIEVYNITGQLIETKVISHKGVGNLKVNAKDLASGAYSYRLVVDGEVIGTNKMILQN